MSLARLVVTAVKVEGRTKSGVARDYRVSRRWVHELGTPPPPEPLALLLPRGCRVSRGSGDRLFAGAPHSRTW